MKKNFLIKQDPLCLNKLVDMLPIVTQKTIDYGGDPLVVKIDQEIFRSLDED